jgi:predicted component of type VI protein secretion system
MDLLGKLDGNDKLDALLQEIVDNPETQKALKAGTAAPAA